MNATLRMILALVCIGAITLCAILIVGQLLGRARLADLTDGDLYTLSDGTRKVFANLNQPVTLKLYYSRVAARKGPEQIRFWNNYFLYVRDLLEEYVDRSGGKLRLEVIDPRPFTEEEDEAVEHGVKRFQLSREESFLFGLVATTELGKEKAIAFFEPDRQTFVEYDLSKLIDGLMQREKKRVGVISSLPVMGTDMSPYMMQMLRMQGRTPEVPWHVVEHLRETWDVERVQADNGTVPGDIDFLMVVHPKDLPEKELYAVDQYVMKGGKLMVFIDPHCVVDQPPQDPRNPMAGMNYKGSSDLNALLEAWGVRMMPGQIAVDRALAMTVQLRPDSKPESFPAYLDLDKSCVNAEEVVTADLHSLRMLYAGVLEEVDGAGTTVSPLLLTSPTGTTWTPAGPFDLRMPNAEKIRRTMIDGEEPLMLACVITGTFKSNFPQGIETPEEEKEEKEATEEGKSEGGNDKSNDKTEKPEDEKTEKAAKKSPEALKESAGGAMVFVVADVDMLTNMVAYQQVFYDIAQVGNNASLVLNMLDYLAGSSELISVRTRGRYKRPFEVVDQIEKEAEKATEAEVETFTRKIEVLSKQLDELGESPAGKDVTLIKSQAVAKRRQIKEEIRKAEKGLRRLQAKRREKVEALGTNLQTWNMAAAPGIILLIAIVLAGLRWVRRTRYTARRN